MQSDGLDSLCALLRNAPETRTARPWLGAPARFRGAARGAVRGAQCAGWFRPPCRRSDCSSSTEGWGPLCKFLGKEVPDEPFLFVNETEDLNKARRVMVIVSHAWLPGHEGHGVPVAVGR